MQGETKNKIKVYVIAILIPLVVGALSAFLTMGNMSMFDEVNTPPLLPPAIFFPIVWSVLYVLMGISSGTVWLRAKESPIGKDTGLFYYGVSLFFNFAWSIVFFNLRWFLFAFIWLLVLLYLIIKTILGYKNYSPVAAYLQIPYVLWVAFAGYLNFGIWFLNR